MWVTPFTLSPSFASALPTIGLFGLKLKRFPQLLGVVVYFVAAVVLILRWKTTWYRSTCPVCPAACDAEDDGAPDILQTCAFHIFLLWVHYMRENVRAATRRGVVTCADGKCMYAGGAPAVHPARPAQGAVQGDAEGTDQRAQGGRVEAATYVVRDAPPPPTPG
jgi:hypothetical protein